MQTRDNQTKDNKSREARGWKQYKIEHRHSTTDHCQKIILNPPFNK